MLIAYHKFTYICVCNFQYFLRVTPYLCTFSYKIWTFEFIHIYECIHTSLLTFIFSHTFLYTPCLFSFSCVHSLTHTQISTHTPAPTRFSVHILALALYDDFSRCLSPGLQPQDGGGGSCWWRLTVPFREGAGPGKVEPSSLGSREVRSRISCQRRWWGFHPHPLWVTLGDI